MRNIKYILSTLLVLSLCLTEAMAQRPRRQNGPVYGVRKEKVQAAPDSAFLAKRDSLHKADSLFKADSVAMLGKSSLELPAFSTAKDSIIEDFSDGKRKIYYYGDVSVKYQDIELTADYMEFDMLTNTVFARGRYDSLAQEWVGRPVMTQAGKTYDMEEVRYNFTSRKARITNMLTQQDDGKLHGQNIKMMAFFLLSRFKFAAVCCAKSVNDVSVGHVWVEFMITVF